MLGILVAGHCWCFILPCLGGFPISAWDTTARLCKARMSFLFCTCPINFPRRRFSVLREIEAFRCHGLFDHVFQCGGVRKAASRNQQHVEASLPNQWSTSIIDHELEGDRLPEQAEARRGRLEGTGEEAQKFVQRVLERRDALAFLGKVKEASGQHLLLLPRPIALEMTGFNEACHVDFRISFHHVL